LEARERLERPRVGRHAAHVDDEDRARRQHGHAGDDRRTPRKSPMTFFLTHELA
jgi:hypothetical protein